MAISSMSMNARVLAGIRRRPGNTAQAVCEGSDQSGSTRRNLPCRTRAKAEVSGAAAMPTPAQANWISNSGELAVARPGALVATFSCSGLLQENQFVGMLFQAARRAAREIRYLGALGAGPDHPQRPDFSRSRYLKGAWLYVDGP